MTTLRFFRSAPSSYEMVRSQLDMAYGYPNAATKTLTAIPFVESLPSDSQGRVYLHISAAYCEYNLPSELLPQLLASGAVEEVTQADYEALLPQPQPIPPPTPIPEGDAFPVSPSNPRFGQ